ncbi:unnamed protein product, partial [Rotaria sp. Silwood1]
LSTYQLADEKFNVCICSKRLMGPISHNKNHEIQVELHIEN